MIKVQYVQVFQDSLGCGYFSWMALALPVVFETEKLLMLHLQQQQMLVGLNTQPLGRMPGDLPSLDQSRVAALVELTWWVNVEIH